MIFHSEICTVNFETNTMIELITVERINRKIPPTNNLLAREEADDLLLMVAYINYCN